ncbi:MAG: GNAT family N-acetyltransferase [Anaerolineales bacterium]|nr:GNAT family N-acetyltransferase [Anaerolineales bacterium]
MNEPGAKVSIREVGTDPDSFEAALTLLKRFFLEEGFTPERSIRESLQSMVASSGSEVFLACRSVKSVGVATVVTSIGLEYGRSAELEYLYVLPKERGKGAVSALVETVYTWCRARHVSTLLVTVTPEGDSTYNLLDFYERRGFKNRGRVLLERNIFNPDFREID